MLLHPKTRITLAPDLGILDEVLVLLGHTFRALDFDAARCADFVERAILDGRVPERLVDADAIRNGGRALRDAAYFPKVDEWCLCLSGGAGDAELDITVEGAGFAALARLIREITSERRVEALRARLSDAQWKLFGPFLVDDIEPAPEAILGPPGIYRREHASIVLRSRTTSVLLDPARLFLGGKDVVPALAPLPRPDAVLVSHGHDDHWHLPSLFEGAKDRSVPVVVPHVPRVNILTRTVFADELALAGQSARAPAWGSRVEIGDMTIEILPFYGEQPTRDAPGGPNGVRSWGNCYVVRGPEISVLLLVDSGADPDGDMRDVVADVVRSSGKVDVVLSCLREFPSPFFGGLEFYWAALPFARLAELSTLHREGRLPFTTCGPEGAAEICAIAGARYFLPYAHGYEGAGAPLRDIGWGEDGVSEAQALGRVAAHAKGAFSSLDWSPGDVALSNGRSLDIRRYGMALG